MRIYLSLKLLAALIILGWPGTAAAIELGGSLTIPDTSTSIPGGDWFHGAEDHEVEPGNVTGQQWDLEGMFIDEVYGPDPSVPFTTMLRKVNLTIVGGFDFLDGEGSHEHSGAGQIPWRAGDLFIGEYVIYGSEAENLPFTFPFNGFEYVLDFDWEAAAAGNPLTYDVIYIGGVTIEGEAPVELTINSRGSDPWRYISGGQEISTGKPATFIENLTELM